jgi:hypothetical protein
MRRIPEYYRDGRSVKSKFFGPARRITIASAIMGHRRLSSAVELIGTLGHTAQSAFRIEYA